MGENGHREKFQPGKEIFEVGFESAFSLELLPLLEFLAAFGKYFCSYDVWVESQGQLAREFLRQVELLSGLHGYIISVSERYREIVCALMCLIVVIKTQRPTGGEIVHGMVG